METEVLRWFQLVVDGVTVTEVAEIHGVSQPGVSRALNRLEEEVSTPLLHRSGRALRATHAGTVFKRHVDALLHDLDDGIAAVNELIDPQAGTVAIAFQLSLGTWLAPRMIGEFRATHPQVRFLLESSLDALGSSLVARGRTDLEFTARRPRNPTVHWEPLFAQPLCLAVPPDHPLMGREDVSLGEVSGEDFVMLRPDWELRTLTDSLCATAGFTPRVAFEGQDLPVVQGFVAAGLGVAVVPSEEPVPGSGRHRIGGLIRLTDEGAHRDVGLAWSENRRLLPSAHLFREHVLAAGRPTWDVAPVRATQPASGAAARQR